MYQLCNGGAGVGRADWSGRDAFALALSGNGWVVMHPLGSPLATTVSWRRTRLARRMADGSLGAPPSLNEL